MPLHLLHHKSYHVYSTANIERVRRDEAEARKKEEAEEMRMQEEDAEARMSILRARAAGGEAPVLREEIGEEEGRFVVQKEKESAGVGDELAAVGRRTTPPSERQKQDLPLTGADGHINFFSALENPRPGKGAAATKNAEYEAEKKAKEAKFEAQFNNALGKPAEELKPWYSTLDLVGEVKGRKRTEREVKKDARMKDWGDPLGVIKKGVRGVREAEEAREEWRRMREVEVGGNGVGVGMRALEVEWRGREGGEARRGGVSRSRSRHRDSESQPRDRRHRSRSRSGHRHCSSRSNRHHQRHRHSRSRSPHRSPKDDLMDRLRRERDAREKAEREKTLAMLNKEKEYRLPGWQAVDGGRYSSQFGIGDVRKRR